MGLEYLHYRVVSGVNGNVTIPVPCLGKDMGRQEELCVHYEFWCLGFRRAATQPRRIAP